MQELKKCYDEWKSVVPLLYDEVHILSLTSIALTVDCFRPSINGGSRVDFVLGQDDRLLLGHANLSEEFSAIAKKPKPQGNESSIAIHDLIASPCQVLRIRTSPVNPNLVASKTEAMHITLYSTPQKEASSKWKSDFTSSEASTTMQLTSTVTYQSATAENQSRGHTMTLLTGQATSGYFSGVYKAGYELIGTAMEWCPREESILASGSKDSNITIWDINRRKPASQVKNVHATGPSETYAGGKGNINDIAFCPPEPSLLASVSDNTHLYIWDRREAKITRQILSHGSAVNSIDWKGHLLITGGDDKAVNVWDVRKLKSPLRRLQYHGKRVGRVFWVENEEAPLRLASCGQDCVAIWDLTKPYSQEPTYDEPNLPELRFIHRGHYAKVLDLSYCNQTEAFVSIAADSTCHVWKPKKGCLM